MSDDVSRILSSLPIEGYISRYVSLKKKGRNFWGLCPFHSEKTPSFSVSPEKGIFKCFGCGKGGNLFSFVQEYERVGFPDALKLLAEQAGIKLSRYQKKSSEREEKKKNDLSDLLEWARKTYQAQIDDPVPQAYLKQRKIKPEMQEVFHLGFAPAKYQFLETSLSRKQGQPEEREKALKGLYELGLVSSSAHNEGTSYNRFRERLIFPIHDDSGKTVGFGGRTLAEATNSAKYINSTDSRLFHKKQSLYNIHRAKNPIRENNMVILVEGYFDVIGLYQKDIKNVVAPLGTSFTNEQAKLIKRFTDRMTIFFDPDPAGKEAALKTLIAARKNKIQAKVVHSLERSKDPFDISIEKDEIDILTMIDSAKDEMSFVLWYYFFHKNSIDDFEEKKQAILDLFLYLQENVEQVWEQLDFIKKASSIVGVPDQTLQYDFKKFLKGRPNAFSSSQGANSQALSPGLDGGEGGRKTKTRKIEKDILAILLRFPEHWSDDFLSDEIKWSTEEMHLLFGFFRDRSKAGEVWQWSDLSGEVITMLSELSKELSSLLAGIIMEFDQVLENEGERKDYSSYLKKMILQKEIGEIDSQIEKVQRQLGLSDHLENKDPDELTMEFQTLIQKKKKFTDAFRGLKYSKVNVN